MASPLVTYAVDGRVGVVSLNRGDKLNAISGDLKRTLVERFHEADERGLIYLADRASTGLHIVRLTGDAAKIAGGN